jgi:DNA-binding transcriptional MerR regulator
MAQWRVKEISDLTDISVRMLRHYDKIGLLKPSMRSSNGYRWYSEQDLARLQQIIALKFFGFGLAQIKTMLQQPPEIYEHLNAQQRMLADQAETLKQVQDALAVVLEQGKASGGSLNWNNLITLIERYRMVDKLKELWADTLSEKEQEGYIKSKQAYPKEVTAWEESIKAMNSGQLGDPEGPDGERAANTFLKLLKVQAKVNASAKMETMTKEAAAEMMQGIQKRISQGVPLSPEGSMWYARAMNAHKLRRWNALYQDITKNLDVDPESEIGKKLAQQWRDVVAENCYGGGSIYYHFGHTLLMNAVRDKAELQKASGIEQTPEEKQKTILNDLKMMSDPRATMWILMALNKSKELV